MNVDDNASDGGAPDDEPAAVGTAEAEVRPAHAHTHAHPHHAHHAHHTHPAAEPERAPAPPSWVYALGRVDVRLPDLDVEKELAHSIGRADTARLTDRQALYEVLSRTENGYLRREVCYVLTVQEVDTYLLRPADPADYDRLVEALRPAPHPADVDVIIGRRGTASPGDPCAGLMLPTVQVSQIYTFDRPELIAELRRPENVGEEQFESAAAEMLDRILELADNSGMGPASRAVNFLAVRYAEIYTLAVDRYAADQALTAIDVRPAPSRGGRTIVHVVFSYTDRRTDVTEKYAVDVDVTGQFPFLHHRKLSRYIEVEHY